MIILISDLKIERNFYVISKHRKVKTLTVQSINGDIESTDLMTHHFADRNNAVVFWIPKSDYYHYATEVNPKQLEDMTKLRLLFVQQYLGLMLQRSVIRDVLRIDQIIFRWVF